MYSSLLLNRKVSDRTFFFNDYFFHTFTWSIFSFAPREGRRWVRLSTYNLFVFTAVIGVTLNWCRMIKPFYSLIFYKYLLYESVSTWLDQPRIVVSKLRRALIYNSCCQHSLSWKIFSKSDILPSIMAYDTIMAYHNVIHINI